MQSKKQLEDFINSGKWKTMKFRIIDTNPNIGEHTFLCSCDECIKIKKVLFRNFTKEHRNNYKNTLIEKILINDGIWRL